MKEELITLATAKLAKEKGFTDFHAPIPSLIFEEKYRPTQSLLQKWLREVHSIAVFPLPEICSGSQERWGIQYAKFEHNHTQNNRFELDGLLSTYEEALETGLQEALELIQKL
jgi:hypothetical protein